MHAVVLSTAETAHLVDGPLQLQRLVADYSALNTVQHLDLWGYIIDISRRISRQLQQQQQQSVQLLHINWTRNNSNRENRQLEDSGFPFNYCYVYSLELFVRSVRFSTHSWHWRTLSRLADSHCPSSPAEGATCSPTWEVYRHECQFVDSVETERQLGGSIDHTRRVINRRMLALVRALSCRNLTDPFGTWFCFTLIFCSFTILR